MSKKKGDPTKAKGPEGLLSWTMRPVSVKEEIHNFLGNILDKVDFVTVEISGGSFKVTGDMSPLEDKDE